MSSESDKGRRATLAAAGGVSLPSRRPQAERSAESRSRIISATIDCLHRLGYSATSTTIVADTAGVSRGRMTHQFPTKLDLMEAVVRSVFESQLVQFRAASEGRAPREVFYDLPEIMWAVASQPAPMAVTELMVASRSDLALAERLRSVQRAIEETAYTRMAAMIELAVVEARPDGLAIHRIFVAAIRGLVIDSLWATNPAEKQDIFRVLKEVLRTLYPPAGSEPGKSVEGQ